MTPRIQPSPLSPFAMRRSLALLSGRAAAASTQHRPVTGNWLRGASGGLGARVGSDGWILSPTSAMGPGQAHGKSKSTRMANKANKTASPWAQPQRHFSSADSAAVCMPEYCRDAAVTTHGGHARHMTTTATATATTAFATVIAAAGVFPLPPPPMPPPRPPRRPPPSRSRR